MVSTAGSFWKLTLIRLLQVLKCLFKASAVSEALLNVSFPSVNNYGYYTNNFQSIWLISSRPLFWLCIFLITMITTVTHLEWLFSCFGCSSSSETQGQIEKFFCPIRRQNGGDRLELVWQDIVPRGSSRRSFFFVPYFSARLDFPSPPLSAPGSPRMDVPLRCVFINYIPCIFLYLLTVKKNTLRLANIQLKIKCSRVLHFSHFHIIANKCVRSLDTNRHSTKTWPASTSSNSPVSN